VERLYWHRAFFITLTSLLNSRYRKEEERQFSRAIQQVEITQPPVFILGHWRSGTTLLHYLLAQDMEQFAFPNTYQVVNPHTFLTTEERNKRRFRRLVPQRRPMDNMALSFDTPQEDEFAPGLMTLFSPYLGMSFPRRERAYERYLTFRTALSAELADWQRAFKVFLKKLTLHSNRALLLKSPPHTARVRLLLEMFPQARFIHVCRDPYRVFQSTRHYFDTAVWYTYLQRPDLAQIDNGIFRRYRLMHDAYLEERKLIPSNQLCEVRFEDMEKDPVGQIHTIYQQLNLPDFGEFRPNLQRYVDSLKGYRKNEFTELPRSLRQQVATEWARTFEEWNYPR
jgi:hypothetical protein